MGQFKVREAGALGLVIFCLLNAIGGFGWTQSWGGIAGVVGASLLGGVTVAYSDEVQGWCRRQASRWFT